MQKLLAFAALSLCLHCVDPASAQSNLPLTGAVRVPVPTAPNEIYPPGTQRIFEWIYSCGDSAGERCRFDCFSGAQREPEIRVEHALNLQMYLVGVSIGRGILPTTYIFYTDRQDGNVIQGSAFILSPNGCNVQGMNLSYSGIPK